MIKRRWPMANSRWVIAAAAVIVLFAGLVIVMGGGINLQFWWRVHTQCPVATYWDLDWSPDGSKIAYAADPVSFRYRKVDIFTLDIDKPGDIQQLTHTGNAHAPRWSPDGAQIAYEDISGDTTWVAVMNSDGTGQKRLSQMGYNTPTWSPDGTTLVTTFYQDGQLTLALIPLSDPVPKSLSIRGRDPNWSLDSKRLIFTQAGLDEVDINGHNQEQLITGGENSHPTWSPDGNSIAFVTVDSADKYEVAIIDLATKRTTMLGDGFSPSWSPDSKKLALISPRTGQTEIYTIHVDGTGLTQLTHNPSNDICLH